MLFALGWWFQTKWCQPEYLIWSWRELPQNTLQTASKKHTEDCRTVWCSDWQAICRQFTDWLWLCRDTKDIIDKDSIGNKESNWVDNKLQKKATNFFNQSNYQMSMMKGNNSCSCMLQAKKMELFTDPIHFIRRTVDGMTGPSSIWVKLEESPFTWLYIFMYHRWWMQSRVTATQKSLNKTIPSVQQHIHCLFLYLQNQSMQHGETITRHTMIQFYLSTNKMFSNQVHLTIQNYFYLTSLGWWAFYLALQFLILMVLWRSVIFFWNQKKAGCLCQKKKWMNRKINEMWLYSC